MEVFFESAPRTPVFALDALKYIPTPAATTAPINQNNHRLEKRFPNVAKIAAVAMANPTDIAVNTGQVRFELGLYASC